MEQMIKSMFPALNQDSDKKIFCDKIIQQMMIDNPTISREYCQEQAERQWDKKESSEFLKGDKQ